MRADALGDRMKGYEQVTQHQLYKRTPVILRIDGRAFHTLTRGLEKPFDRGLYTAMHRTAMALYEDIQGCKLVYSQSDEISCLLTDWETFETEQWFGGNLQKMVSVAASTATAAFNANFHKRGTFDARVFQLPREDVTNYFLWRQRDAERKSVSSLAHEVLGHRACQGVSTRDLITLLEQREIRWNELPDIQKRGFCIRDGLLDEHIPRFGDDREYVERHLVIPE